MEDNEALSSMDLESLEFTANNTAKSQTETDNASVTSDADSDVTNDSTGWIDAIERTDLAAENVSDGAVAGPSCVDDASLLEPRAKRSRK